MKASFGLYSINVLATKIKFPDHQTNHNSTFTEQVMNSFHKVNELYDDTLNEIHHLLYTTNISTNACFMSRNTIKQEDKLSFINAMEKKITDHEEGVHWYIFHHDTFPN